MISALAKLFHVVTILDLGKQIPFRRAALKWIQHDIPSIPVVESREVASVRICKHSAVAPRDRSAEKFPDGRRFTGAGCADQLEVLGLVFFGDCDTRQGNRPAVGLLQAGCAALNSSSVDQYGTTVSVATVIFVALDANSPRRLEVKTADIRTALPFCVCSMMVDQSMVNNPRRRRSPLSRRNAARCSRRARRGALSRRNAATRSPSLRLQRSNASDHLVAPRPQQADFMLRWERTNA